MNARASLPPPNMDDVLSRRFSPPASTSAPRSTSATGTPVAHVAPVVPEQAGTTPSPASRRTSSTSATGATSTPMTRRSFYLPAATADALAQAASDLHYTSRGAIPKHVVLDAVIRAGLTHLPELTQQLEREHHNSSVQE